MMRPNVDDDDDDDRCVCATNYIKYAWLQNTNAKRMTKVFVVADFFLYAVGGMVVVRLLLLRVN